MTLEGRTAVVTGGGSGYGCGIAAALAARGAKVWITGRDEAKLAAAVKKISEISRGRGVLAASPVPAASPFRADVTSPADWDALFAAVGEVDILVNNAGAGVKIAPVAEQSDADILQAINVNLTGTVLGCARAARQMGARGSGAIVNVSSVCALYAWPGWSVYTAAKAGLSKFSHGLHTELRPKGVRVFCVTPSWGQTDFNRACGITSASEDPSLAPKCISPEDIGRLVVQLLETPDHLAVPDVTLQPMIQAIEPM